MPGPQSPEALKRYKAERKEIYRRVYGKPRRIRDEQNFTQIVKHSLWQAFKILIIAVVLIGFLLMGLGSGMLTGYIATAQDVEVGDIRNMSEETKVLDKDGKLIATLKGGSVQSEFVPYDSIKQTYLAKAFIAIEDERFRSHPGIDSKRILSAVFSAIANGGSPTHGGSTLTQQTIKLISGKDDISAQRKIQEWYNAVRLERQRSKDGILELYLNLVPMANNYVGVQAAAKAYFNKNAKDLNLAECAFLAGIPNRPATYNPLTEYGRRNALRRMRFILNKMLELGKINGEEYEQALNTELRFDFSQSERNKEVIHSYFVDYVIDEVIKDLVRRKGYSPELARIAVYNYGLTIETTCDSTLQSRLEQVFHNRSLFVTDESKLPDTPEEPEGAITVLDNERSQLAYIRGMVGGYGDKKSNFSFNRAVSARRQPGSSIKPLLVYTPALETGKISMATPCDDHEVFLDPDRPDTPYPLNAYRKYWGPQTLEQAVVFSINTIAADIYANKLTPQVGLEYLARMGIDRRDEPYVSGALGGFREGVTTYEMAAAYSTLANQGMYREPTAYTRVLSNDGSVLLDNSQHNVTQVFRPATTYVMTTLLEATAAAPHNNAKPEGMTAAGKTGTTEDFNDAWFCGYTPYYTAAVWYGYDNANGRRTSVPLNDAKNAIRIWRAAMEAIHQDLPDRPFVRPEGVSSAVVDKKTGLLAGPGCKDTMTVLLINGSPANPTTYCQAEDDDKDKDKKDKDKKDKKKKDKDKDDDDFWSRHGDSAQPPEDPNDSGFMRPLYP